MQVFPFIILIFSVILHEVAHGYMALRLGDPTAKYEGRLTLNPIKHIDPVGSILVPIVTSFAGVTFGWAKPVPFNPYNLRNKRWGEALVAASGPLSNIALAIIFALVIRSADVLGLTQTTAILCEYIVGINLVLAIFNLFPVPPLDGSKILFAFLPAHALRFREVFEKYGFVLILVVIFAGWPLISSIVQFLFFVLTGVNF